MAIIKCLSAKKSLRDGLAYVENIEKTKGLITGINCNTDTALKEMLLTKKLYEKQTGRQYKHYVQSFSPSDNITPEDAHQIGLEFVKKAHQFDGFEVVVATHTDKKHIHNHIIVNSVSFVCGKKLQQSKADLQKLKNISNELCENYGLTIPEKGKNIDHQERETVAAYNRGTFDLITMADNEMAESWTHNIAKKVVNYAQKATLRDEFIHLLEADGVRVIWKDNRKNIVFEDIHRQKLGQRYKVRNSTLGDRYNLDLSKEGLENGFTRNYEQQRTIEADRQIADYTITRHQQRASGADKEIDNLVGRAAERKEREREQAKFVAEQNQNRLDEPEKIRSRPSGRIRGL